MSTPEALKLPVSELEGIARDIRAEIIAYSNHAKLPHLGSCLSCVDILTCLYFHFLKLDTTDSTNPKRDRFVLSKGHGAPALFQVLARRGFYPQADLYKPDHGDGKFGEHPPVPQDLPGIEAATGSLGHGLPMGLGMALAGRLNKFPYRVFALLSDGECNEGSIWEAALFAAAQKLDNLCVIVDFNKWQATGRSEEVLALNPFVEKWQSFGWNTCRIDGHSMQDLLSTIEGWPSGQGKPFAIIADTVKGKGVSFMEDDNNWHYRIPTEDEVAQAKQELGVL
ncbi:MAG: transketolase [Pseudomonadota bacterium]